MPLSLGELDSSRRGCHPGNDNVLVVPVIVEELEVQKHVVKTGKVRIMYEGCPRARGGGRRAALW
jgi:hypothetical protein